MSNFQQPPSYHYPEQGQPTTSQQQSYYHPQASYEQTQGGYYQQGYQQQQQQQPYYPPQGQKPLGGGVSAATLGPDGAPARSHSPKIVSKPKYNDVWATILFVLVFLSFAGLAIVGKSIPVVAL